MEIRIQSIHFDATEQLQAFIQKKVSKLEKYYEAPGPFPNPEAKAWLRRWYCTREGVGE